MFSFNRTKVCNFCGKKHDINKSKLRYVDGRNNRWLYDVICEDCNNRIKKFIGKLKGYRSKTILY